MSKINLGKIDPAMATLPADTEGIHWHLPFESPMTLAGFYWFETDGIYERLPIAGRPDRVTRFLQGEKTVVEGKDCGAFILSPQTAGGQIRFRTDSTRIMLQGEMREDSTMDNMAKTGSDGFDLYVKESDGWRFYGVTRTDHKTLTFSATICSGLKKRMRDVLIHFPLYNGVKNVFVGLEEDAMVEEATPFADPRPIIFYGTSITQGGCASRPGMCSSNILSRLLEQEVINLGFSGSGIGEPEIAQMLAEIKNPALYLLDYCWNVDPKALAITLPNMIDTIRKEHPTVPILLLAPTPGREQQVEFETPDKTLKQKADIMRDETCRRNQQGDDKVFFFDALYDCLGMEPMECTVDGCHLTDMGFYFFSKSILPHIYHALGKK